MEILNSFLESFLSFILLYKYPGLFLIAYTAAFLIPLPASTILAAAGAFSSQGYLNFSIVVIVAVIANIAGDATGYFLARRYGIKILQHIGFRRLLNSKRYRSMASYITDFAPSLIFFTRFLTEAGPAVNILSGIANVRIKTFFLYDIAGEISYVFLFAGTGYFLGTRWENNIEFFTQAGLIIGSIGLIIILIQTVIYHRNRKPDY